MLVLVCKMTAPMKPVEVVAAAMGSKLEVCQRRILSLEGLRSAKLGTLL